MEISSHDLPMTVYQALSLSPIPKCSRHCFLLAVGSEPLSRDQRIRVASSGQNSEVFQMSRLRMLAGFSLPFRADIGGGILPLNVISPPDLAASSQVLSQVGEVQVMSLFKKYLFFPKPNKKTLLCRLIGMFPCPVPGLKCVGPFSGCSAAPARLLGSVSYSVLG